MTSIPYGANSKGTDHHRARLALENVLESETFSEMPRLKRFLEYAVTETIAGNGDRLKGVVIACDVFDKTDPSEAQFTTIVRVEAGRLRRRLNDYYQREGKNESLRIRMPKGGYAVVFEEVVENSTIPNVQPNKTGHSGGRLTLRHSVLIIAALIALVAIFISWNRYNVNTDGHAPVQASASTNSKPLMAVMPFKNMVTDDPDGSIAYGLTEDIITDLSGLPTLEVISASSVLPFRDLEIKPLDMRKKLGVQYVLSGSVRGASPDLRVTAQLFDAVNGSQLWAVRFDRQMASELAMQDELANKVVDSLSIQFQGSGFPIPGQQHNTDPDTWSLYKQAMNLVNPPSEPSRLELSLQVFRQIMQRDPEFAGGFAGAAYVLAFKAFFGHSQAIKKDVQTALEMANRSQTLNPDFGLSYSAQAFAFLVDRDFEEAMIASGRAVQLAPNDPYVMAYHGFILSAMGDPNAGITFVETALRLDPLNVRTPYLNILGVINLQAGHYEVALGAFLDNRERGGPMGPGNESFLAATYAALGDEAQATATLAIANLLKNNNQDWESWVIRSWQHKKDSDHFLDLVAQIREQVN